ncbi:hypothetical protein D3C78_1382760 [compost metagenome]
MGCHQENVPFTQVDAVVTAVIPDVQIGIPFKLVEELLYRVIVKIGALVRPADDGNHVIAVLPNLLIIDRGLEPMRVTV